MQILRPTCGKTHNYDISVLVTQTATERDINPGAWMKLLPYIRELFITGMCYKCQSEIFHTSTPGYDLGEEVGECAVCGCTLYKSDLESDRCPSCVAKLSEIDTYD